MGCQATPLNFEISPEKIETARNNDGLLTMEIELSLECNFNCCYCYTGQNELSRSELSQEEIKDVICQAQDLGAYKIIILGGEPMLHPYIFEHIEFMNGRGLEVEMFTNGSLITEKNARRLFANNVRVVLKKNSFQKDLQDKLSGKKGAFNIINTALTNLKNAGYPSNKAILAISTIICKQNIEELISMWCWCRSQNFLPYFEMLTPQGNAKSNDWLYVDPGTIAGLFEKLSQIDREEYGIRWDPQPPLAGNRCLRHQYSCVVTACGDVMPCVGVNLSLGNIRNARLKKIIRESEVLNNLKNYKRLIKGPCKVCEKIDYCYGCRGAAYQLTGDYLASDPLCWKNYQKTEKILKLPVSVSNIIPHQIPMQIVDKLEKLQERTATVSVKISPHNPFVSHNGKLDRVAYLEMMAQSIAAENCFKLLSVGQEQKGLLVSSKKMKIYEDAKVGDHLTIIVSKMAKVGDFGVIYGRIYNHEKLLTEGEIKIWHPDTLSLETNLDTAYNNSSNYR